MIIKHLANQLKTSRNNQLILEIRTKTGKRKLIKKFCILVGDDEICICNYDDEEGNYREMIVDDLLCENLTKDCYLTIFTKRLCYIVDSFDIKKKGDKIHIIYDRGNVGIVN